MCKTYYSVEVVIVILVGWWACITCSVIILLLKLLAFLTNFDHLQYYLEKNLDARERELEREAELEEKAPKVKAKSKMSKVNPYNYL